MHHYQKSERFFWSSLSFATAHTADVDMYATGINNGYLNPVIQKNLLTEDTFQNLLGSIQNFYDSHNLPWVWVVKQDLISQDLIKKMSLELLDQSSGMSMDLSNSVMIQPSSNFTIKENNDDLTDWGLSLCQAFQSPLEISNQYIGAKKKQAGSKTNFHHFVGYVDTIPVSCLTLSIQEKSARLNDIGTIPDYQNKGYATQMVVHALQKASALGAHFCFLEASQAGTRVYEKIGFKNIFSNFYFKVNKHP